MNSTRYSRLIVSSETLRKQLNEVFKNQTEYVKINRDGITFHGKEEIWIGGHAEMEMSFEFNSDMFTKIQKVLNCVSEQPITIGFSEDRAVLTVEV